ncbi:hypothetical protein L9F63_012481, partial [Diploptera punctata]
SLLYRINAISPKKPNRTPKSNSSNNTVGYRDTSRSISHNRYPDVVRDAHEATGKVEKSPAIQQKSSRSGVQKESVNNVGAGKRKRGRPPRSSTNCSQINTRQRAKRQRANSKKNYAEVDINESELEPQQEEETGLRRAVKGTPKTSRRN